MTGAVVLACLLAQAEPPETRIGLMPGAGGMSLDRRIELVRDLGVTHFRPNAVIADGQRRAERECEAAREAGLAIVLTVRANGGGANRPTSPPQDLDAYRRALGEILDRVRPELLVIENEENSALFYTGTPEEYGQELAASVDAAHERHIPCTNGGMVSALVALLTYQSYLDAGDEDRARSLAQRAFDADLRRLLGTARAREQVEKGRALLRVYTEVGIDYVNFHWHNDDPDALGEVVEFLRRETGKPVVNNEVSSTTEEPAAARALLAKLVELRLPYVVWYSIDSPHTRALMNADGTLRPHGEAFRAFLRERGR